jgi:hypothetical protein
VHRPPSPGRATALYDELLHLSEATTASLRAGHDEHLESAMALRERLVASITKTPVTPAEAPEIRATIHKVLALDQEFLGLVEARKADVRRALARISEGRSALESYRAAPPSSAVYIERLG